MAQLGLLHIVKRQQLSCCFLVIVLYLFVISVSGREYTVTNFVGNNAILPCEVDVDTCGRVYFITWTKNVSNDWERVYLYSENFETALGDFTNPFRASFKLQNDSAFLKIHSLLYEDEGVYKCDVTYVRGKCPSLSFIKLNTLVVPSEPVITVDNKVVENGTTIGAFLEGSSILLKCKSSGGKPAPEVSWRNGTYPLVTKVVHTPGEQGGVDVVSVVRIALSRWDLDARLVCFVNSNVTSTRISKWVKLDIHVRPLALTIRGRSVPVVEGEMVSLTCTVEGARPAANITWYNRSEVVRPQPIDSKDLMSDGTYRTTNTLVFIASRHDHHGDFFCKGTNSVIQKRLETPLFQVTTLEVLFSPAVEVLPRGYYSVTESDKAIFTCYFNANPPNVTEIVWFKNNDIFSQTPTDRLRLTKTPIPTLEIRNVRREDAGTFSCQVKNAYGRGTSINLVELDVLYSPQVSLNLQSPIAVEGTNSSVLLTCDTLDGNPKNLTRVKWYKDEELLEESTSSKLILTSIKRHFAGNYSCQGNNGADWSPISSPEVLTVYYPPGPSKVLSKEEKMVKGNPVTLYCEISDPGFPPASIFRWEINDLVLNNTSDVYVSEPISVGAEGNYSCAAINQVATGDSAAPFKLDALAPPRLVEELPRTGGALRNLQSVNLRCRVECEPLCDITWYRNNKSLNGSKLFTIETFREAPDVDNNTFDSVVSILSWNMRHFPSESFDFNNFTCKSSENEVGDSVSSTMVFRLEYPPEDIKISVVQLEILEGEIPEDLVCSASAHPNGKYIWLQRGKPVSQGPVLSFNSSLSKEMAGNYTCVVRNRHGRAKTAAFIRVLHKPDCVISAGYDNSGTPLLTCQAHSQPRVVNFTWYRDNVTVHVDQVNVGVSHSLLKLPKKHKDYSTLYSCVAANAIGLSYPCFVPLSKLPSPEGWVQLLLSEENLIIVAGVAGGLVVLVIVLLVSLIVVLFNRRMPKNKKTELMQRQTPEGRELTVDDTPGGASPLLTILDKPDGSPLLKPIVGDLNCTELVTGDRVGRPLHFPINRNGNDRR
ncbi:hemicentin-2-like isoform X2 [Tachypleus tridentatus]|uniref:hemicentin-2-like isoform X2 n=1 Tax=Tachypleus tridentatus TaxID=6853 RepID=UPI003FD5FED5